MRGRVAILIGCFCVLISGVLSAGNDSLRVFLFMSETCPICRSITPEIMRVSAEFRDKPVEFTMVFPNESLSTDSTRRAFASKYGLEIPMIADPGRVLTGRLGVNITPEVVVTSTTGEVIYRGLIDDSFERIGKRRQVTTHHFLYDALQQYFGKQEVSPAYTKAVGCKIQTLIQ